MHVLANQEWYVYTYYSIYMALHMYVYRSLSLSIYIYMRNYIWYIILRTIVLLGGKKATLCLNFQFSD